MREGGSYAWEGRIVDIDDLKILGVVAKYGSMNRAAGELHMVQSSVAARVRLLEEQFGVQLFIRHSRGVKLSDAGLRLLSYSERIQALFQEALGAVREDGKPKGILRIGSTAPNASMRLPKIVAEYTRRYPDVELAMSVGSTEELTSQVLERQLDAAFVAGPSSHRELCEEPIFLEELVLVTQESFQSIQAIAQAEDVKAVVLEHGCSYREKLSRTLDAFGIEHKVLSVASFDAIRACVLAGVGVTLVPKEVLRTLWKDERFASHALPADGGVSKTVLIRRHDSPAPSALQAFLAMIRAASNLEEGIS